MGLLVVIGELWDSLKPIYFLLNNKNTKSHLRKKVALSQYFMLVIFCLTNHLPFLEP